MNGEKPKEAKENIWEDIYGETEIEFGPNNKVKITERKSGEVTERKEEPPEGAYYQLNEFEQKRVDAELKKFLDKFQESREAQSYSPADFNEILEKKREELAKKMLSLREENKK